LPVSACTPLFFCFSSRILCAAFSQWCSAGDEDAVRKLLLHAPLAVEAPKWTDPHTKANALMQAHFSRTVLAGDLAADQRTVVQQSTRLLQVCLPS
jgi:hypothetical protein